MLYIFRSSFPWDDDVNEMNTTADLGSTVDSKLLGKDPNIYHM